MGVAEQNGAANSVPPSKEELVELRDLHPSLWPSISIFALARKGRVCPCPEFDAFGVRLPAVVDAMVKEVELKLREMREAKKEASGAK